MKDGTVRVAGGLPYDSNGPLSAIGSVEAYDPAQNAFVAAGSLPSTRYGHGAAALPRGGLMVTGGSGGNTVDLFGSWPWHSWFAVDTLETPSVGDFDGDGKDDIATWLATTTRQVYLALSYGSGTAQESVWLDSIGLDPSDVLLAGDVDSVSTYERPRVADVNGDGRADIVTFATDSPTARGDVYVALSDGERFVDHNRVANSSTKWHDWFAVQPSEEIRIGDLDGDGKADVIVFAQGEGKVYVSLGR